MLGKSKNGFLLGYSVILILCCRSPHQTVVFLYAIRHT